MAEEHIRLAGVQRLSVLTIEALRRAAVQIQRQFFSGGNHGLRDQRADFDAVSGAETWQREAQKQRKEQTAYSLRTAQALFDRWSELDRYLLVKYVDGNVKSENEQGFIENGSGKDIPDKIQFPGYNEKWKRAVAADNGEVLKVVK